MNKLAPCEERWKTNGHSAGGWGGGEKLKTEETAPRAGGSRKEMRKVTAIKINRLRRKWSFHVRAGEGAAVSYSRGPGALDRNNSRIVPSRGWARERGVGVGPGSGCRKFEMFLSIYCFNRAPSSRDNAAVVEKNRLPAHGLDCSYAVISASYLTKQKPPICRWYWYGITWFYTARGTKLCGLSTAHLH